MGDLDNLPIFLGKFITQLNEIGDATRTTIQNPYDKPLPGSGRETDFMKAFRRLQSGARSIVEYLKATDLVQDGKPKTSARDTLDGKFKLVKEDFGFYYRVFELKDKTDLVKRLKGQVDEADRNWTGLYKMLTPSQNKKVKFAIPLGPLPAMVSGGKASRERFVIATIGADILRPV
ncbi:MAG: hypothetical protein ACRD3O_00480 [Terriglobia bacterium]